MRRVREGLTQVSNEAEKRAKNTGLTISHLLSRNSGARHTEA